MKILYIITKSNWGGAQRHVFDLAVESKKRGHNVIVALGGAGILYDRLQKEGISTATIGKMGRDMKITDDVFSLRDISKIIKKERPDVLHLHSPKAAGLGSFTGRVWGIKKIIYTVHGWAWNEDRSLLQKSIIAFFSWITMLFSTDIILLSKKEFEQTRTFPIIENRLRLIPLGISSPKFLTQKDARGFIEEKVGEPILKRIVIGTIAELHKNKGYIYAIEAMEKIVSVFPTILYFIIGDGEEKNHLTSIIKEKGLEKNIILSGYVDEASKYLKGFSIFLLPSVKEGLPYTIIEAGYAGLPVISTVVGGIPEIIDDMKSGIIIQSKKPNEIAHSITFLLEHKNIQKEYGKSLQEKVSTHFGLEKMIAEILKVYEKN